MERGKGIKALERLSWYPNLCKPGQIRLCEDVSSNGNSYLMWKIFSANTKMDCPLYLVFKCKLIKKFS